MNKPIYALATPYATGAIHIIRISGFNIYKLLNKITKLPIKKEGFKIQRNQIIDKKSKKIIDDVLLMKYVSPKSYTGEDLIEINCHGSIHIANEIMNLLECNGIELATPGEFTRRAFLNKKIDLNQAASIDLLIKTKNNITRDLALHSLLGDSSKKIKKIQFDLFKIIGGFEVIIDYPEYENEIFDFKKIKNDIKKINNEIVNLISSSSKILAINDGIKIAIIGKPNVGKSSLLNALVKQDRALVSNIAGTTRDIVEVNALIENFNVILLDTAGIHKHRSQLEKKGIKKTYKIIKDANLIIFLTDIKNKLDTNEKTIIKKLNLWKKDYIVCYNKKDLIKKNDKKIIKLIDDCVIISAKKNDIESLLLAIQKKLKNYYFDNLVSSKWQLNLLNLVNKNLIDFDKTIDKNPYVDILIDYLKKANENLLKILGEIQDYDLMDEIFKYFCLGK